MLLLCNELFISFYNPGSLPLYTSFFDCGIPVNAMFAFSLGLVGVELLFSGGFAS